jgi:DNA/RNA endonuclease YhcR with UshA esterase domain
MLRLITVFLFLCSLSPARCVSIAQAYEKIGSDTCVSGKVLKVLQIPAGHFTLNFCEDDNKSCGFSVVVFRDDLRDVGDVRQLEGKDIEIHGRIKEYRGRAEIVLKDVRQLRGESARIPPMPKTYDVSRHGNYNAGSFYGNKTPKQSKGTKSKKRSDPIDEIEPGMQE